MRIQVQPGRPPVALVFPALSTHMHMRAHRNTHMHTPQTCTRRCTHMHTQPSTCNAHTNTHTHVHTSSTCTCTNTCTHNAHPAQTHMHTNTHIYTQTHAHVHTERGYGRGQAMGTKPSGLTVFQKVPPVPTSGCTCLHCGGPVRSPSVLPQHPAPWRHAGARLGRPTRLGSPGTAPC